MQVSASTTTTTITGLTNNATHTFKVAAVNSVGTGAAGTSNAVTPNNTLLGLGTPATLDADDSNSVQLGVKFSTDTFGIATGIRFYKSAANTGTHVGNLWTAGGTRLATATFTSETSTGWQEADFSTPVALTPNTTYIASYYAPDGGYSVTANGFASALNVAPLHAPASSTTANGVFAYGGSSAFPTDTWNAGNYFVDVLFAPQGAPGTVTGVSATAGAASATVSWNAPATGGVATKYVVTPYVGSTAQASTTVTGTPPATTTTITGLSGQAYTFRVTASNPVGDGPASDASNSVTPTTLAAPSAPQNVEAAAADTSARVNWNAPSSTGSGPITGYTVTPFDGTTAKTPVQTDATARTASVSGLTNGTPYTFRVTATSAAGTSPASSASNAVTPNKTIFGFATPDVVDSGDGGSVVLGVKLTSDVSGVVSGLRFYKAAGNTGSHVGSLWAADGTLLRSGTFTNETSSGWQEVDFSVPVSVTAGTTYVASYLAPNGHYSVTAPAFATAGADNPPLHAVSNVTSPNGLYAYSGSSVFPTNSWNASNYFVDVLFAPTP